MIQSFHSFLCSCLNCTSTILIAKTHKHVLAHSSLQYSKRDNCNDDTSIIVCTVAYSSLLSFHTFGRFWSLSVAFGRFHSLLVAFIHFQSRRVTSTCIRSLSFAFICVRSLSFAFVRFSSLSFTFVCLYSLQFALRSFAFIHFEFF